MTARNESDSQPIWHISSAGSEWSSDVAVLIYVAMATVVLQVLFGGR